MEGIEIELQRRQSRDEGEQNTDSLLLNREYNLTVHRSEQQREHQEQQHHNFKHAYCQHDSESPHLPSHPSSASRRTNLPSLPQPPPRNPTKDLDRHAPPPPRNPPRNAPLPPPKRRPAPIPNCATPQSRKSPTRSLTLHHPVPLRQRSILMALLRRSTTLLRPRL